MPKTPKTPAKARPKPRPLKSPKKPVVSYEFVDDEAYESDDGVLVDREDPSGPASTQSVNPAPADEDEEYDRDFINDGDPFEDTESLRYPSLSPPSSPAKADAPSMDDRSPSPDRVETYTPSRIHRGRQSAREVPVTPSPSKSKKIYDDVIELDDTSDEDLTAMDVDDSVFKKPAGVKASALPPSLLTRSAASKRPVVATQFTVPSTGRCVKQEPADEDTGAPVEDPPAIVNAPWFDSSTSRVDHGDLALQEGIRSSLASPVSLKKRRNPRYSPEWDPPPISQLLEDIEAGKEEAAASGKRKTRPRSQEPHKVSTRSATKGKGKARQTSPVPSLEDAPSEDESHPRKKAAVSPAKTKSGGKSRSAGKKPIDADASEPEDMPDGSLAGFLIRMGYPAVPAAGLRDEPVALTMAQFQRVSGGDAPTDNLDDAEDGGDDSGAEDTVFLEDIEVYRVYFNIKAKCGVFDLRLQSVSLRPTYAGLHPLPSNRRILASYDPDRNSREEVPMSTGGHINWESWYNQNPRMLAANSVGAIVFQEAKPNYVNMSRISPLRLNTRMSGGASATCRMYIEDRVAICVSAICCTVSNLVAPKKIGIKSERMRKSISGVLHDQEWSDLIAADKSVAFQTMISPEVITQTTSPAEQRNARTVPSSMFSSPSFAAKPSGTTRTTRSYSSSAKTLLAYNDPVPIYDARKTIINFETDLGRLGDVLPVFPGEVPVGSFTVVGYTLSSYMATLSGTSDRVPHVGFNILWAIVCGTATVGGLTGVASGSGSKVAGGSRDR
ncbi:hypothetical protein C8R46DRAFT_1207166 [Mycena filopes]|nr:hypothetical protein C8R46DRAFT_1207166 [Mycena filopes]